MKKYSKNFNVILLSIIISFTLVLNSFSMNYINNNTNISTKYTNEIKIELMEDKKSLKDDSYPDYWRLSVVPGLAHIVMGESTKGFGIILVVSLGISAILSSLPAFFELKDSYNLSLKNQETISFSSFSSIMPVIYLIPTIVLTFLFYLWSIFDAKSLNEFKREEFLNKKVKISENGIVYYNLFNF